VEKSSSSSAMPVSNRTIVVLKLADRNLNGNGYRQAAIAPLWD